MEEEKNIQESIEQSKEQEEEISEQIIERESNQNQKDIVETNTPKQQEEVSREQSQKLKILDVLTPDQIRSKVQDLVLFEGEINKYKPGISIQYISRWGQVTKNEFMYFKNQWAATCWLRKPIVVVPLIYIQSVQKVQVITESSKKYQSKYDKSTKKYLDKYQFELFLKSNVNLEMLSKKTDLSILKDLSTINQHEQNISQQECEKEKKDEESNVDNNSENINNKEVLVKIEEDENENYHRESVSPKVKYGSNEIEMPSPPKIIVKNPPEPESNNNNQSLSQEECKDKLISTPNKIYKSACLEDISKNIKVLTPNQTFQKMPDISPGHLMKTPLSKKSSRDKGLNKSNISSKQQHESKIIVEDDVKFNDEKELEQYKSFRQEKSQLYLAASAKEEIQTRNPSAWLPSLSSTKHK